MPPLSWRRPAALGKLENFRGTRKFTSESSSEVRPMPTSAHHAGSGPVALRRRKGRLFVELLEDRTLLAAAITGHVFNDVNGNGQPVTGSSLPGTTVYLDGNGNGKFDTKE